MIELKEESLMEVNGGLIMVGLAIGLAAAAVVAVAVPVVVKKFYDMGYDAGRRNAETDIWKYDNR
jgi:hypothetical protein